MFWSVNHSRTSQSTFSVRIEYFETGGGDEYKISGWDKPKSRQHKVPLAFNAAFNNFLYRMILYSLCSGTNDLTRVSVNVCVFTICIWGINGWCKAVY